MNRMPTTKTGTRTSSILRSLLHARLERFELGIDLLAGLQLGHFLFQRLGRGTQAGGLGATLGEVDVALENVEAREGVLRAAGRIDLAQLEAVVGAFQPGRDRALAVARLAQLLLQLGDVFLGPAQ